MNKIPATICDHMIFFHFHCCACCCCWKIINFFFSFIFIAAALEEEQKNNANSNGTDKSELNGKQKHQMKHRELFLSRQVETLPATHIRGKCSVTLLNEEESLLSYLNKDVSSCTVESNHQFYFFKFLQININLLFCSDYCRTHFSTVSSSIQPKRLS